MRHMFVCVFSMYISLFATHISKLSANTCVYNLGSFNVYKSETKMSTTNSIYRVIQDKIQWLLSAHCEKKSSYGHVSNSELLLRENCLNLRT